MKEAYVTGGAAAWLCTVPLAYGRCMLLSCMRRGGQQSVVGLVGTGSGQAAGLNVPRAAPSILCMPVPRQLRKRKGGMERTAGGRLVGGAAAQGGGGGRRSDGARGRGQARRG